MPLFFSMIMMFIPLTALALEKIECYSGNEVIYSASGKDISFEDGLFSITDDKSGKVIFINANCIVTINQ